MLDGEEEEEEEEEEKEEEEGSKKMNKSKVSYLFFSTLLKVSGVFRIDTCIAVEQQSDVVCKLFSLLCFVFWE